MCKGEIKTVCSTNGRPPGPTTTLEMFWPACTVTRRGTTDWRASEMMRWFRCTPFGCSAERRVVITHWRAGGIAASGMLSRNVPHVPGLRGAMSMPWLALMCSVAAIKIVLPAVCSVSFTVMVSVAAAAVAAAVLTRWVTSSTMWPSNTVLLTRLVTSSAMWPSNTVLLTLLITSSTVWLSNTVLVSPTVMVTGGHWCDSL